MRDSLFTNGALDTLKMGKFPQFIQDVIHHCISTSRSQVDNPSLYSVKTFMEASEMKEGNFKKLVPAQLWATRRIWWFIWKMLNHILPTRITLLQHHVPIEMTTCALCWENQAETIAHLFIHCSQWLVFVKEIEIWAGMRIRVRDFAELQWLFTTKSRKPWLNIRKMIFAYSAWGWWKWRNHTIFRGHDLTRRTALLPSVSYLCEEQIRTHGGLSNISTVIAERWLRGRQFSSLDGLLADRAT